MAIMVGHIQCGNESCKKNIDFFHEGMQYANCNYEVTCPHCEQISRFIGTSTLRFKGETLNGFAEAKEILD